eukprot:scaffold93482_cov16-Tisochrysis_lutea.AAC.1
MLGMATQWSWTAAWADREAHAFFNTWCSIVWFFCRRVKEEFENGNVVGLDVATGEPFDPIMAGVLDNFIVKKQ